MLSTYKIAAITGVNRQRITGLLRAAGGRSPFIRRWRQDQE